MNNLLPYCLLLVLSLSAQAEIPHTFSSGTPVIAAEVNENFEYVMKNASGGCSATQQDNSVLIECADGTSGVVASYGTVVIVPSGTIEGSIPDITELSVGTIYVVDANDVALGRLYRVQAPERSYDFWVDWHTEDRTASGSFYLAIDNTLEDVSLRSVNFYYASENCTGQPVTEPGDTYSLIYSADDMQFYVVSYIDWADGFLAKSVKALAQDTESIKDGDCQPTEQVLRIRVPIPYTPAPEILNAAYPVRLEQPSSE